MAAVHNQFARSLNFTGVGVNANDILFTSSDVTPYNTFTFMTTAGNVFIEASVDGTNFTTVPLSFQDLSSTAPQTYVAATAATGRAYAFYGKVRVIRMKQSGATAATGFMLAAVQ